MTNSGTIGGALGIALGVGMLGTALKTEQEAFKTKKKKGKDKRQWW
jgi:hypothetical protein